jgi:hypothetical protein
MVGTIDEQLCLQRLELVVADGRLVVMAVAVCVLSSWWLLYGWHH